MSSLSSQQPRLPSSTSDARDRLYRQVLALVDFQDVASTGTRLPGLARQAMRLDELYLVLADDLGAVETLTIDVQIKVPGGIFTSVLAAPMVYGSGSGSGIQDPMVLDPAFVAGGSPIPCGTVFRTIRTEANNDVEPANEIVFELSPAI